MNIDHLSQPELQKRLAAARAKIDVDVRYYHYKNPQKYYHIVAIGMIEATETPAVIYQAEYGEKIIWVRPIENFLAMVEHNGKMVRRFNKEEK